MCGEAAGVLSEEENKGAASFLPVIFIGSLNSCFSTYLQHDLGNAITIVIRWAQFLQVSVGSEACPIFYQFITDSIVEVFIKNTFL